MANLAKYGTGTEAMRESVLRSLAILTLSGTHRDINHYRPKDILEEMRSRREDDIPESQDILPLLRPYLQERLVLRARYIKDGKQREHQWANMYRANVQEKAKELEGILGTKI
jgi:hypothetical protein